MPVDNDHDVRDDTRRRSVLVSRRTAAELSGLSLPQVDYWIRRGVVGTGGSGGRWLPRRRTTVDALALAVAVELRSRGVSVREIQAVLPYVLTDSAEWHPMLELVDVDAMQERLTAASAKVTTATVPAVPAVPDEEPRPPRRRIPRTAAVVAAAVLLVSAVAVAIVLNLSPARPADAPAIPHLPDAAAPPVLPTSAPGSAPLVLPPPERPSLGAPPIVVVPSRPAAAPLPTGAPAADAVPPAEPSAPVAPAAPAADATADDATTPDAGAAERQPSGQGADNQPSGGVLQQTADTVNDLLGGR